MLRRRRNIRIYCLTNGHNITIAITFSFDNILENNILKRTAVENMLIIKFHF